MTILEAITQVQSLRPNQYDEAMMVRWLSDLDGLIWQEYIKWHMKPEREEEPEEEQEEVPLPEKAPLEEMTWADIARVANAGKAREYFKKRDAKTIFFPEPVLGSDSIVVEVADFYYDDLADGSGKAAISFLMRDMFMDPVAMHGSSDAVPWFDTRFFTMVLPSVRNAIIDAAGDGVITPIIKRFHGTDGKEYSGAVTVWQPAIYEVAQNFSPEEAPLGIDYCYSIFDPLDPASRIKRYPGTGEPEPWWTRTPSGSDTYHYIDADGSASVLVSPRLEQGIVLGFCVGKVEQQEEVEPERPKWPYDPELDMDKTLIVPEPYSGLYVKYLAAQVDYHNGELDRYTNSMILFNKALSDYANWFNREHMPRQDNFIRF